MSLFGWRASLECRFLVTWTERGWWVCLAGGLLLNVVCLWDELNGIMSLFGWRASLECCFLVTWAERGWWVCLAGGLLLNVVCLWDELNGDDESVWLAGFSWMLFACDMSWRGMMSLFGWRASLECCLLVRWAERGWWVCLAGGLLFNVVCLWDELNRDDESVWLAGFSWMLFACEMNWTGWGVCLAGRLLLNVVRLWDELNGDEESVWLADFSWMLFACEMNWTGMMSLFGWRASLECYLLVRWTEQGWWVCLAGRLLLNVVCLWDELNRDDESVWLAGFSWMLFACEMNWTGMMSLFGWRASLECRLLVRWAERGWWVRLAGGLLLNVVCLWDELNGDDESVWLAGFSWMLWDELLSKEEEVICK